MTEPARVRPRPGRPADGRPVVLVDEPGVDVPLYGDDRWDLRGLTRRPTSPRIWIDFGRIPARQRAAAKEILWSWLNNRTPIDRLERTTAARERMAASTVVACYQGDLAPFLIWLDERGIVRLRDVTPADLDEFATSVSAMATVRDRKAQRLFTVSRIWLHSPYLSPEHRLIRPRWEDEAGRDFLGPSEWSAENKTHPIHPQTMSPLLVWALRLVEDLSPDILAAVRLHDRLAGGIRERARRGDREKVADHCRRLRDAGAPLPGFASRTGGVSIAQSYLAATLDVGLTALHRDRIPADLPIVIGAPLDIPITGRLADTGHPWTVSIDWYEVPLLRRLLATACLIVAGYLSGMRSDEIRSLRRGCCAPTPRSADTPPHHELTGHEFKGALDEDGNQIAGGRPRGEPWYVITPVALAIEVAESLSPSPLVFDAAMFAGSRRIEREGAIDASTSRIRIAELIGWANGHAERTGRLHERIPDDDNGAVTLVRFRRTLAWFIYRQPGGRVALGVQYGHLRGYTSEGYGARTRSGLRDVFPMEQARARIDALVAGKERWEAGEGVSGPAAARYIEGLAEAGRVFSGGYVTERDLRALNRDPRLRIFDNGVQPVACCYDASKSLCHPDRDGAPNPARTPDVTRCDPRCANQARTDTHIGMLVTEARWHLDQAASPFTPGPLQVRHRQRADTIAGIVGRHHRDRRTTETVTP